MGGSPPLPPRSVPSVFVPNQFGEQPPRPLGEGELWLHLRLLKRLEFRNNAPEHGNCASAAFVSCCSGRSASRKDSGDGRSCRCIGRLRFPSRRSESHLQKCSLIRTSRCCPAKLVNIRKPWWLFLWPASTIPGNSCEPTRPTTGGRARGVSSYFFRRRSPAPESVSFPLPLSIDGFLLPKFSDTISRNSFRNVSSHRLNPSDAYCLTNSPCLVLIPSRHPSLVALSGDMGPDRFVPELGRKDLALHFIGACHGNAIGHSTVGLGDTTRRGGDGGDEGLHLACAIYPDAAGSAFRHARLSPLHC